MSMPAYPYMPAPFETQNLHDDDAEVIDSLVQPTSAPADPKGAITPTDPVQQYKPQSVTRLYANTFTFSQAQQAITAYTAMRLLSEDVNRGTCRIRVFSSTATPAVGDYILVSDDLSKVSAGTASICIPVRPNAPVLDLDGHTGQLWVIPGPSLTAASTLEVVAFGITTVDGRVQTI